MNHNRPAPVVNGPRLLQDLAELATFGGREDGGVDRVAGSAADLESRVWLAKRIEQAGLQARTDDIGNVFGRRASGTGPWLLAGSHTDTVPAAGRLDGAYGVIAALEVLRTLHEAGHPAADHLEIVSFWDEEGASPTSQGGLAGSSALCEDPHVQELFAYLELHIEQGPRMEQSGLHLAAVEGIVGVQRHTVTVHGIANHGGTTPMDARADAGRVVSQSAARIVELAAACDPTMITNVGCVEFLPGAPNVVPGEARMVVEFRAASEESLNRAAEGLSALVLDNAAREKCTAEIVRTSRKPVSRFDPVLCDLVADSLEPVHPATGRMFSYAGHDASAMNSRVPTAMLFVPSTGGISHSPAEHTPEAQLVQGAQALLQTVVRAQTLRPASRVALRP
ncbi:M20/M25/M40 family metallo-hydrolase [Streptomyces xanthophaeus]|uniref:M20/M25/M40 family metallo-hydrolase n=1 Tax=Streptomyces xanthophaeus TaxID=67385 RepID=UPI002649C351|nr:M20/M25/M40 family metallo-hydrolase [Streptomyces xanthophaeus]WKD32119.1 M20/M25/M40 family metallo-hydrolase [Streptomyces xanthophaeus]